MAFFSVHPLAQLERGYPLNPNLGTVLPPPRRSLTAVPPGRLQRQAAAEQALFYDAISSGFGAVAGDSTLLERLRAPSGDCHSDSPPQLRGRAAHPWQLPNERELQPAVAAVRQQLQLRLRLQVCATSRGERLRVPLLTYRLQMSRTYTGSEE